MDILHNLYVNTGLKGLVQFFSAKAPPKKTTAVNILENTGVSGAAGFFEAHPARLAAALGGELQKFFLPETAVPGPVKIIAGEERLTPVSYALPPAGARATR
ncbi:MAG: hypothetical protein LBD99_02680 [Candidatus Margulisbacteria bacterium]|jgi:hypothetical protein|nr:hypothetical protein [Candidatus Margulisiibacteriota bacterium]